MMPSRLPKQVAIRLSPFSPVPTPKTLLSRPLPQSLSSEKCRRSVMAHLRSLSTMVVMPILRCLSQQLALRASHGETSSSPTLKLEALVEQSFFVARRMPFTTVNSSPLALSLSLAATLQQSLPTPTLRRRTRSSITSHRCICTDQPSPQPNRMLCSCTTRERCLALLCIIPPSYSIRVISAKRVVPRTLESSLLQATETDLSLSSETPFLEASWPPQVSTSMQRLSLH